MGDKAIFYDVAQVAELLNCSTKAVRHKVARRLIPWQKIGKRLVFKKTELDRFLKSLPGTSAVEAELNWKARQR
ncbi:MAG: hypothetical protein OJF51_000119 [Nitrospira sp.]|jgi:excisionase family DNA binding protein|nr:MAG: hypothetical protein OJF51_000119 [Nitrospira sp.]